MATIPLRGPIGGCEISCRVSASGHDFSHAETGLPQVLCRRTARLKPCPDIRFVTIIREARYCSPSSRGMAERFTGDLCRSLTRT
jgi:hypothetical protein